MATGSLIEKQRVHYSEFLKFNLPLPSKAEQQKIAKILNHCDEVIKLKREYINEEYKRKKWLTQNIFTADERVSNSKCKWNTFELGDIFDYIQPTPFIVKSTNYRDEYETPVLTAGKTFILGYTNEKDGIYSDVPVVIFDDFTTAIKYVDFSFKIKSSAIKMLKIKPGFNIRFAYEAMQNIKYVIGGHERHWISKFSMLTVDAPEIEEQENIMKLLDTVDKEINLLEEELFYWQQKKKSLMQLLLTGLVRVEV